MSRSVCLAHCVYSVHRVNCSQQPVPTRSSDSISPRMVAYKVSLLGVPPVTTPNEREPGTGDRHISPQTYGTGCRYTGQFVSHSWVIQDLLDTVARLSTQDGRPATSSRTPKLQAQCMAGRHQSTYRPPRTCRRIPFVSDTVGAWRWPPLMTYVIPVLNRRGSVPSNVYLSQSHPVQGYLPGSQTLQGYPPMPQDQYQQPQIQPAMSDLVAHRPTPSLTIPSATGGHFPGPHSASPPHTPWYTPQPSPHPPPHPQLNPEFTFVSYRR